MRLGYKPWVARLDIRANKETRRRRGRRRKIEERKKKREKKKGEGNVPRRRWRHGRSTVFGRMLRHYPFHVAKTNARRRRACGTAHVRVHAYTRDGTRGSYARGQQSAPVRPESKLSSRSPASLRSAPLSLTRERVHQRTHTQAGTRAESRSQSPAVGGRFDVAAAAATFTTPNTFISRSDILPLPSSRLLHRVPSSLSRFLWLLCSCTTLSTSFRNSSRCPRGLNFTPCRDSWAWRHAWPAFSHDQFPLFPAFRFANKPWFLDLWETRLIFLRSMEHEF